MNWIPFFILAPAIILALAYFHKQTTTEIKELRTTVKVLLESFQTQITQLQDYLQKAEHLNRETQLNQASQLTESLLKRMNEVAFHQKNQLDTFTKQLAQLTTSNETRLDKLRENIDQKLKSLQEDNNKKLEQMRQTVDEKLHATLEKRLGDSFKLVSERLEMVHKGLGEMQTLASGVGDLKRVLTNVKTRGTWGEVQLGNLLEQLLTPEQYEQNVRTKKGSNAFVEYALKLPGKNGEAPVYLPIDAKFPQETYIQLIEAQEKADAAQVEVLTKQLVTQIKHEGRQIRDKYIDPPYTTDFGIMFLPTEGLYAEVLRYPDVQETLQSQYRVIVAGPTTLAALLNSLQMGFRTLAIEKRSSEVWAILGSVKTEFGKFGDILEKTKKKLQEAGNTIDLASQKSRTIERKLRNVESLPGEESASLGAFGISAEEEASITEPSLF